MTLPPEFQLAFDIYGVEVEVNAAVGKSGR